MTSPPEPGDRLERALHLLLRATPPSPAEARALLAAHADLRDLLEPMLERLMRCPPPPAGPPPAAGRPAGPAR